MRQQLRVRAWLWCRQVGGKSGVPIAALFWAVAAQLRFQGLMASAGSRLADCLQGAVLRAVSRRRGGARRHLGLVQRAGMARQEVPEIPQGCPEQTTEGRGPFNLPMPRIWGCGGACSRLYFWGEDGRDAPGNAPEP
jgi:hypothetical protein